MSDEYGGTHSPTEPAPITDSTLDEPYPNAPVMPHTGQPSTVSHDELDIHAEKRADVLVDCGFATKDATDPEPEPVVE